MIPEHSEEEWFNNLLQGEEAALRYFIKTYSPIIERTVFAIVNDATDTEEITSSTFLKLWQERQTLKTPAHLVNFLHRVARRASIDYLRRQKTLSAGQQEWLALHKEEDSKSNRELKEDQELRAEILQEVNQRVNTLSPACKEVFLLRYQEGKDTGEIAEQLAISQQTVYNQLSRAIGLLRKTLKEKKLLG